MFKKLIVAAIVVAVVVGAVKGTWLGSHFRLWTKKMGQRVKDAVPPEREIERLKMELADLRGQDEKVIDTVARQTVQADKLHGQAEALRADLGRREKALKGMHVALATEGEEVAYNGASYARADMEKQLRLDFAAFEADEELLKSRDAHLAELRKSLAMNKKKLGELKVQRERMATDLQRLETALAEERRAQALEAGTLDDSAYRRLTDDLEAVKERVALLKAKRELRGQPDEGPVRSAEKSREVDERIKARLGGKVAD
ncbi:MAG: hypothetical protein K2W96_01445 [Gemmataceae bacterium]|nr:hypothetical protein [Gemmataceae bacterium]